MSRARAIGVAAATVQHRRHSGAGRPDLVQAFATGWRFWAWVPADVQGLVLLADPTLPGDKMLAAVSRPTFPPGVCTGCGCSELDACPGDLGEGCHWIDARRTRCSSCGPAPVSAAARKAKKPSPVRRAGRGWSWSKADDAFLRQAYPHLPTVIVAALLGRTVAATYGRALARWGLRKTDAYNTSAASGRWQPGAAAGFSTRFQKGQSPANKGLRRPGWAPGRMRETQFQKGQRNGHAARNWMPIGSRRLIDGYVYIKLADVQGVPHTHNWYPEHVIAWEYAQGRPLPPGHALRFRNGNRRDVRLENLELISRRENMARNSVHNLPAPLKETVQLLGALNRQIRRRDHAAQEQDRRPA
jgi:hypothetical protein